MKRKIIFILVSVLSLALFTSLCAQGAPEEKSEQKPFSLLEELAKPKFQFSPAKRGEMRRDPFQPPAELVRVRERRILAEEPLKGIYTLAQERVLAGVAEEMVEEMKERLDKKDYQGVQALRDKLAPLLATRFYDIEANSRLTVVRNQVEIISVALIYYDVRRYFSEMRQAFQKGEYEAVGKLYEELLVVAGKEKEPKSLKLAFIVQAASLMDNRAAIRLEFLSQEIPISFIAWTPEAPYAIVSNKIVGTGDLVPPNLEIYRIEKERVVFRYKGEVMAKSITE